MSRKALVIPVTEQDLRIRKGLKVGEAAFLLGLSYDVTLRLVNDGDLSAVKVGKYHVVPVSEIDRFLGQARRSA